MRRWPILGAVVLVLLLVAGGLWRRADGTGRGFAAHGADETIAALRAEGVVVTDVATPPPSAEFGAATETKRLTIATPTGPGLVTVLVFARAEDRDRAAATFGDPQVARVARYYARDNVALVLNPTVPDAVAARCKAALARLK